MTREVAGTFGPQGIRVNCIAPGHDQHTDATRRCWSTPTTASPTSATAPPSATRATHGTSRAAVLFLAGPDGRYITGLEMPVDGGTTIRC